MSKWFTALVEKKIDGEWYIVDAPNFCEKDSNFAKYLRHQAELGLIKKNPEATEGVSKAWEHYHRPLIDDEKYPVELWVIDQRAYENILAHWEGQDGLKLLLNDEIKMGIFSQFEEGIGHPKDNWDTRVILRYD